MRIKMTQTTANETLNIGVIGLGNIAQQHINNILEQKVAGARVSAICSREQNQLSLQYKKHTILTTIQAIRP